MSGSKRKTTRRARGEGRFDLLPSGLYRNVVKVHGRAIAGEAAPTKAEARANTLERIAREKRGLAPDSGQSFTTFARSWLKTRQKRLSPTTAEVYGYWINSLEATPLGKMEVGAINARHLRQWKASCDWAEETLRKRCMWINQLLADAGTDVRIDVPKKKDHARRPLKPKEIAELSEAFANADEKIILAALLCWKVGLRRSEACGLMHEDREGDGINVRRVVLITKGKIHVRHKGKSAASLAWVPLPAELRPLIGNGKGYVLGTDKSPPNPKVLYGDIKRLFGSTSLKNIKYMSFHALRRTYGRTLLESGADVVTAAKAMRHDPTMLLKEYARSREDLMLAAVEKAFKAPVPEGQESHEDTPEAASGS